MINTITNSLLANAQVVTTLAVVAVAAVLYYCADRWENSNNGSNRKAKGVNKSEYKLLNTIPLSSTESINSIPLSAISFPEPIQTLNSQYWYGLNGYTTIVSTRLNLALLFRIRRAKQSQQITNN